MPIKYKHLGFPTDLACTCGIKQSIREVILTADRRKIPIDQNIYPDQYFSGHICEGCESSIWYFFLDYSTDNRIIELQNKEPLSLEIPDELNNLYENVQDVYNELSQRYQVVLDFPAALFVTGYLEHHNISHIAENIYSYLPLIVIREWLAIEQSENTDIVLIIPYQSNEDKVYGEIKVNYNLPVEDRELFKKLSFGIWDLLVGHYFGPLDDLTWSIDSFFPIE